MCLLFTAPCKRSVATCLWVGPYRSALCRQSKILQCIFISTHFWLVSFRNSLHQETPQLGPSRRTLHIKMFQTNRFYKTRTIIQTVSCFSIGYHENSIRSSYAYWNNNPTNHPTRLSAAPTAAARAALRVGPPPMTRTSPSAMDTEPRMAAADRGSFASTSHSGAIRSLPPRITQVVHPEPPERMPASRWAVPLPTLPAAPETISEKEYSPMTHPGADTSAKRIPSGHQSVP